MTVTNVHKDPERLRLIITAEFDAPLERVWQLWEDPRQLERWWGPPTYPATFVDHDLVAGGSVTYYMTGPEGDQPWGWWRIISVDPPTRLEFEDGFSDENGNPNLEMPTIRMVVTLAGRADGGTRMTIEDTFTSLQAMEQLIEMGMEEGMALAMGQIDDLLAEDVRPGVGA